MFPAVLGASILGRASEPGDARPDGGSPVSYHVHDIRRWTTNKHQKVDRPPYGGGPGMVMQCQPVWDSVRAVLSMAEPSGPRRARLLLMSPQGRRLTQSLAEELAREDRLVLVAGRYEGIDERVIQKLSSEHGLEELSIGDYVLSGGELAAMVVIDAVVRLIPGVLGHEESAHRDSFSPGSDRLLDHPHYTRPEEWMGLRVPEVLLSGDHAKIEAWRRAESDRRTRERRSDLLRPDRLEHRSIDPTAGEPG